MTCRPQLKGTGIFRPKIKLQNNKQKVKLSNSGSGEANPKERPVKAKGLEKLLMWLAPAQTSTMFPPARGSLTQVSISGHCQMWKPQKWRERTCTGWGNSDNTSGVVNEMEEKQKARREPASQPGQGSGLRSGRREQNIRCS